MATIAVMGGSYNPVHIGHMMVAQYVAQWCHGIDRVMMVLSPANPLKKGTTDMVADHHRLAMLRLACSQSDDIVIASDIELSMPRPSYTIDTLRRLKAENPSDNFRLVIGSDNWKCFNRWREADTIISDFGLIVYPRPGYPRASVPRHLASRVTVIDAPVTEISSTWIRRAIGHGQKVNFFLPPGVHEYISQHNLY